MMPFAFGRKFWEQNGVGKRGRESRDHSGCVSQCSHPSTHKSGTGEEQQ